MFEKGPIKGDGIDITIRNNPRHILSPNDWDMVTKARFGKIPVAEYREWYLGLLRERWGTRKSEFIELAREGRDQAVKLKCFCGSSSRYCHANFAVAFMNALSEKL